MKVEILGSGGAATIPRPLCACAVCAEAREKGAPYARTGPSTFVHGPDILFDTPEESKEQLNRAKITNIAACFYSHWHPDHTMGRRVFETIGVDWRSWPPALRRQKRTRVYLPEQVAADFRARRGLLDHLEFMREQGTVEIVELRDGDAVEVGDVSVRPFRLAEDYVYAFVLEREAARVLIAPDETNGWTPPAWVRGVDLAVIPIGFCELDPRSGERLVDAEHPLIRLEATFEETLGIVDELDARRVVLTHVEEMNGLSHDEWQEVARERGVEIAWDGLVLEV